LFTPLKYSLVLSVLTLLLLIASPLIIFTYEFLQNPDCLKVDVKSVEYVNNETIKAQVNVFYCSIIPLKDFKLVIGEDEIIFDEISRGNTTKTITLKVYDNEVKGIEFKVAGIYGFKLHYR